MRLHDQLVDQTERYRLIRLQNLNKRKPLARDIHSEHEALMNALLDRDARGVSFVSGGTATRTRHRIRRVSKPQARAFGCPGRTRATGLFQPVFPRTNLRLLVQGRCVSAANSGFDSPPNPPLPHRRVELERQTQFARYGQPWRSGCPRAVSASSIAWLTRAIAAGLSVSDVSLEIPS